VEHFKNRAKRALVNRWTFPMYNDIV